MDRHTHALTHTPHAITATAADTRFTRSRKPKPAQSANHNCHKQRQSSVLPTQRHRQAARKERPSQGETSAAATTKPNKGTLCIHHCTWRPYTTRQVDNHRHYSKLYSAPPESPGRKAQIDTPLAESIIMVLRGRIVRHAAGRWLPGLNTVASIIGLPRCTRTRRSLRGEK
jgi:hypothetical protein